MSVSLARRIRRIGMLPTLSLHEVMDENQQKKLKNLHSNMDTAHEKVVAAQQRLDAAKSNPTSSEVERTAAYNMLNEANAMHAGTKRNLADLLADLERQLGTARRRRLPLTPEDIANEASKLRKEAKEARVNRKRLAAGKNPLTPKKAA